MFCNQCGYKLAISSNFCSKCGAELPDLNLEKNEGLDKSKTKNTQPGTAKSNSGEPQLVKPLKQAKSSKKKWVLIAIPLLLIAWFVSHIAIMNKRYMQAAVQHQFNIQSCEIDSESIQACYQAAEVMSDNLSPSYDSEKAKGFFANVCQNLSLGDNEAEYLAMKQKSCNYAGNYEKACEAKHAWSCYILALNEEYLNKKAKGYEGPPEITDIRQGDYDGLTKLKNSCDYGEIEACVLYAKGLLYYGDRDTDMSYRVAKESCDKGNETLCGYIRRGHFAALGHVGNLSDGESLRRIFPKKIQFPEELLSGENSIKCLANFNVSNLGEVSKINSMTCNVKSAVGPASESLQKMLYIPLLKDGKPVERKFEELTMNFQILDENGKPLPL